MFIMFGVSVLVTVPNRLTLSAVITDSLAKLTQIKESEEVNR